MPRALLVVLDGCADRPVKELGGKTPLEFAVKPTIDRLVAEGSCGLMDVISPGIRPGSDTAHLAIFGYDPYKYYPGRGPFEALGAGLTLNPGDVAFRTNVATVNSDLVVVDRRGGRYIDPAEVKEIENIINNEVLPILRSKYGIDAVYKQTVEHRGVLVLRGNVSPHITDTDPHVTGVRVSEAKALSDDAKVTANYINEFTKLVYEKLSKAEFNEKRRREGKGPINMVLLRGAGSLRNFEPLSLRYRIKPAIIAGVALIRGIGRALGMDAINVDNYIGSKDDDFIAAFQAAARALNNYDFVFVHVKPTDSMSHDGDARGKAMIIERVDAGIRRFLEEAPSDTYVFITCDHATPITVREHTGDPVPFMAWGPDVMRDDVTQFSERACAKGFWSRIRGIDVMNIIANYLGTLEKFGE
ncbi:2,3-bisphosphoglycerate-independent phosphoglycerate mutase [Vulcanisaeta distributa]|uniref:2,3-bisphosphoglycerate-independent phosphoglycerate mutase n=1 Tax=Vulcanisaeta distributa (strain DSM 14429 / JCM 11212 / NBRC 100878 / IC-017) TaxID=572478 RepID=E1QR91_VULDI|nr:2,3-bisphosphoglycerate-independent phosphoglycerate mutase [Vulcanisaeta distributa]ADN50588.1 phosphonopyruvate decarboxylase-related protein [Vulcanisaeta distributa DSM 14429]